MSSTSYTRSFLSCLRRAFTIWVLGGVVIGVELGLISGQLSQSVALGLGLGLTLGLLQATFSNWMSWRCPHGRRQTTRLDPREEDPR